MVGKGPTRGLLRPLRGSGFALGQPDAFGAGAFTLRLKLSALQPLQPAIVPLCVFSCLLQRRSGGRFLQL